MYEQGLISKDSIDKSFNGWLASMKVRNARKSVYSMKMLYKKLFMKGETNNDR